MIKSGYAAPKAPGKNEFANARIALLATRWNTEVVNALLRGARACLKDWGVAQSQLFYAPGAYEIPLALKFVAQSGDWHGAVTLGAVIRGDTPHFDFVAGECARGVQDVALAHGFPTGFGVLTVNNAKQAKDRCGPGKTNKGYEAAAAMLEMLRLKRQLS